MLPTSGPDLSEFAQHGIFSLFFLKYTNFDG